MNRTDTPRQPIEPCWHDPLAYALARTGADTPVALLAQQIAGGRVTLEWTPTDRPADPRLSTTRAVVAALVATRDHAFRTGSAGTAEGCLVLQRHLEAGRLAPALVPQPKPMGRHGYGWATPPVAPCSPVHWWGQGWAAMPAPARLHTTEQEARRYGDLRGGLRWSFEALRAEADTERLAIKLNEAVQAELEPAEVHPLALEIVNRIHGGEPADRIIETLRQERRLFAGVAAAIRELADAEHRLKRLWVEAQGQEVTA